MVNDFRNQTGISLEKDNTAMQRVTEEAEKCKKALSTAASYTVNLPFLTMKNGEPVHMDMTRFFL